MFYEPKDGHGLAHNPFNAIVTPRPIAWIATRGADGRENLAPYSFFNAIAYTPPQIMFASTSAKADRGDTKDSLANIRDTGVFCVNVVETAARAIPAALECRATQIVTLEGANNFMVIATVVGIHLRDDCVVDGRFDITRFAPLARLGYRDYASIAQVFELTRPGD